MYHLSNKYVDDVQIHMNQYSMYIYRVYVPTRQYACTHFVKTLQFEVTLESKMPGICIHVQECAG
jgi:hypothetical protein